MRIIFTQYLVQGSFCFNHCINVISLQLRWGIKETPVALLAAFISSSRLSDAVVIKPKSCWEIKSESPIISSAGGSINGLICSDWQLHWLRTWWNKVDQHLQMMVPQKITDFGNFTLNQKQLRCCACPLALQYVGLWFLNKIKNPTLDPLDSSWSPHLVILPQTLKWGLLPNPCKAADIPNACASSFHHTFSFHLTSH